MESKTFLDFLPTNFRHEKSFFIQNNLTYFEKLSNLTDLDMNEIQRKSSLCTLNNLKKIRAIAIFKKEIGISPPQAYLLLHCGISSLKCKFCCCSTSFSLCVCSECINNFCNNASQ